MWAKRCKIQNAEPVAEFFRSAGNYYRTDSTENHEKSSSESEDDINHLIYLNTIWCDPDEKNYLNKKLQIIQNKFIRTIYKEEYFSINNQTPNYKKKIHTKDLFVKNKILTLSQINVAECCQMAHKIIKKDINIDVVMKKNSDIHTHNTRNSAKIHIFKVKTNFKKKGFMHKTSVAYNNLPNALKIINNHSTFRKKLKIHILNSGVT